MSLASDAVNNIRINGTGRLYVNDVGALGPGMDVGEIDGLSDSFSTNETEVKSTRTAAKPTIFTIDDGTEGSINFGLRESSIENLEMAYQADPHNVLSQIDDTLDAVATAVVEKIFSDLGKVDCHIYKIGHGTVTGGPFDVGENVVGQLSSATGKVAWVGSGYVELIAVSGTFSSGETLTGSVSAATAQASSIEKLEDFVVTDHQTVPTTRYTQGVDYDVDADYGYIRKNPGSTMPDTVYISCDHPAVDIDQIHAMSAGNVEKKCTFVSDKGDRGPRQRFVYFRVKLALNGESQKIGDGEAVIPMTGTIQADTSRPTNQQFLQIEQFAS